MFKDVTADDVCEELKRQHAVGARTSLKRWGVSHAAHEGLLIQKSATSPDIAEGLRPGSAGGGWSSVAGALLASPTMSAPVPMVEFTRAGGYLYFKKGSLPVPRQQAASELRIHAADTDAEYDTMLELCQVGA